MTVSYQLSPAVSRASSPCSSRWSVDSALRYQGCDGTYGYCRDDFVQKTAGNLIRYLEDELQTASEHVAGRDDQISSLKNDIASIRDSSSSFLNRVMSDCCKVDQALSKIEEEMNDFKGQANNKQSRIDSFMFDMRVVAGEMQKQEQLVLELRKQLENEQAQSGCSRARIEELENSLKDKDTQDQSQVILELREQLGAERVQSASSRSRIEELENSLREQQARHETRDQQQEISELRGKLENEQAQSESSHKRTEELVDALKSQQALFDTQQDLILQLRQQLEQERAQSVSSRARTEELEGSPNAAQELQLAGCALRSQEGLILELRTNLESERAQTGRIKQLLAASQLEARNTALHVTELERSCSDSTVLITELRSQVSELSSGKSDFSKQWLENAELKQKIAIAENQQVESSSLQESFDALTSKLREADCQLKEKDDSILELEEKVLMERAEAQASQARVDELECSLKELGCSTRAEMQKIKEFAQNLIAAANDANLGSRSGSSQGWQTPRTPGTLSLKGGSLSLKQGVQTPPRVQTPPIPRIGVQTPRSAGSSLKQGSITEDFKSMSEHEFLQQTPGFKCSLPGSLLSEEHISKLAPGGTYDLPVWAVRWDQRALCTHLTFRQSIYKLLEELWHDRQTPADVTRRKPLVVFVKKGPDGHSAVYSADYRRLVAFVMYQALSRDELFRVKCSIRTRDSKLRL